MATTKKPRNKGRGANTALRPLKRRVNSCGEHVYAGMDKRNHPICSGVSLAFISSGSSD